MENEFFGGEYTPNYGNMYTKQERSWSAYILFYERVHDVAAEDAGLLDVVADAAAAAAPLAVPSATAGGRTTSTALLPKINALLDNDRGGGGVPATILKSVLRGNVEYLHRTEQFNPAYFSFVHDFLVSQTATGTASDATVLSTAKFATNFVFNTYLHSQGNLRACSNICPALEDYLCKHQIACSWFLRELGGGTHWLRSLLLECKDPAIRKSAMALIWTVLSSNTATESSKMVDLEQQVAVELFKLLDMGASEYAANTAELFTLYSRYVDLGDRQRMFCIGKGLIERIVTFLLGAELGVALFPSAAGANGGAAVEATTAVVSGSAPTPKPKVWDPLQQRSFRWLRSAMFKLVRGTDLTMLCDSGCEACDNPFSLSSLEMPSRLEKVLFDPTFLDVFVMQSLSNGTPVSREETFSFCCCIAWGNMLFSKLLISSVLSKLGNVEVDPKPLFTLVHRLLIMQDGLQETRIQTFLMDQETGGGMLPLVVKFKQCGNARRAYLYLKSIVLLSDQLTQVRVALSSQPHWGELALWLDGQLASAYVGYTSNTETDFYGNDDVIRRTNSAELTCEASLLIWSEGAEQKQQQQQQVAAEREKKDADGAAAIVEGGDFALEA